MLPNLTMHINILMKNVFQVEYLQKKNRELENRIQDLLDTKQNVTSEVVDLSNKNEELCQELNEIDHLAQQLERHKEIVLETADKEIGEAKVITNVSKCEGSAPFYLALYLLIKRKDFLACERKVKKTFFLIFLTLHRISHLKWMNHNGFVSLLY